MAEAFNSLFKAELVREKGPGHGIDDLELAVAEYVDWYNHRRYTASSASSHPSAIVFVHVVHEDVDVHEPRRHAVSLPDLDAEGHRLGARQPRPAAGLTHGRALELEEAGPMSGTLIDLLPELTRRRALVGWMLASFLVTFLATRAITRAIRTGRGPFRNAKFGGVHVHHQVHGIFLLLGAGTAEFTYRPATRGQTCWPSCSGWAPR
jgi:Integrase core domain